MLESQDVTAIDEAPGGAGPEEKGAASSPQVVRIRRIYRRFTPFYDAFRAAWSRWTRPIEDDLDRLFSERIGPDTRILELAPGTGINIERLLRGNREFGSYLGIDASPEMLARARSKAHGDERVELRVGDATDLKNLASRFDLVVSTWLLSHLDAPAVAVHDALGTLAPGGTGVFVFFTTPRSRLIALVIRAIGRPFSYRLVDPDSIRKLPGLERLESCANGMATLALFRAPTYVAPSR